MAEGRRWTRRKVILIVVVALLLLLGLQQLALRDLRRLERDYIAAREPTACATQALIPYAFRSEGVSDQELDDTIAELVEEAGAEVAEVRARFRARGNVLPFPPLRAARRALGEALDAQEDLYEAMINRPEDSNEELRVSGRANNRTERRLATVRRFLLVDPHSDWDQRFVCDEEPPPVPPP